MTTDLVVLIIIESPRVHEAKDGVDDAPDRNIEYNIIIFNMKNLQKYFMKSIWKKIFSYFQIIRENNIPTLGKDLFHNDQIGIMHGFATIR